MKNSLVSFRRLRSKFLQNINGKNVSTSITYCLKETKKWLFNIFKIENPNINISLPTFYKYIPKKFIYSKKRTDVCPIRLSEQEHLRLNQFLLTNSSPRLADESKKNLEVINIHKKIVLHQRKQFENDFQNLDEYEFVLIMDFKENFRLGEGPNETKKEFFNKSQISVLGFALAYKKNDNILIDYHTYLSKIFYP